VSQREVETDKVKTSTHIIPPEFTAMGKKRIEEFVAIQTQQLDKLQEVSRNWFERMQSEAMLASELSAKLTAARSMPEVASAYQEWAARHMEMAAEDAKRIFSDSQKLAKTGARLLTGDWQPNGGGIST
jgi:cell division septum initiation protein DivIVA